MYTLLSCQHCSHVVNYTGLISHLQLHELTESFLSILQLLKNTLVCGLLFFSRRNQTLFLFFRALMEAGTSSVLFIFLTKSTGLSVSLCTSATATVGSCTVCLSLRKSWGVSDNSTLSARCVLVFAKCQSTYEHQMCACVLKKPSHQPVQMKTIL